MSHGSARARPLHAPRHRAEDLAACTGPSGSSTMRSMRHLDVVVLSCALGACGAPAANHGGGTPSRGAGVTAEVTAPRTPEALAGERIALGPFSMVAPAAWVITPVTSSMRAAQFELPAAAGLEAELVVYYFGAGGAGTVDANLERWFGQFTQADGRATREVATIEHAQFAGQDATLASVAGHYHAAAMPGGDAIIDKDDQAMRAAIVGSPAGPYFFKLVGARPTVEANAEAFRAMLTSLQLR